MTIDDVWSIALIAFASVLGAGAALLVIVALAAVIAAAAESWANRR